MDLRILPIAEPVTNQSATDNVLSEDVLTTILGGLHGSRNYLISFDDDGDSGYNIAAMLAGHYVEYNLTGDKKSTLQGLSMYLYLEVDSKTHQVKSFDVTGTPPSGSRYVYLKVASRTTTTSHIWNVNKSAFQRMQLREITPPSTLNTLVLRCGTATNVENLS